VSRIKPGRKVLVRSNRKNRTALKGLVKIQGLWEIDKRSLAARMLVRWKKQLVVALGGEQEISPQRMCLVDLAVRTRLFVESLDAFLVGEQSLMNKKAKSVLPVLMQRQTLADSLTKILKTLGLNRQHGKILSLKEYWSTPLEVGHDESSEGTEGENNSGQHERSATVREDVQAAAVSKR
jgi:hypothetical protein